MSANTNGAASNSVPFDNDHNVYVLGAGFSCHAGLPLMWNFLQTMREAHPWLVQTGKQRSAEAIEHVLSFRLRAAAASYRINIDVENVEHLFSLASAVDDERLGKALPIALCATLDFAHQTHRGERQPVTFVRYPESSYPSSWRAPPSDNERGHVEYPGPIAQVMVGRMLGWNETRGASARNTIITFNYDTIVEDALKGLDVPFDYALDAAAATQAIEGRDSVPLLKLHGSTNWALSEPTHDVSVRWTT